MAQNIIATDTQRLGNWLKFEELPHLFVCREILPLANVDAKTTGSVLDSTGKLVTKATAEDATYILITDLHAPANPHFSGVAVLARGHAIIGSKAVLFGDDVDDADKEKAFAKLKEKNIFAVDQIVGQFENVL